MLICCGRNHQMSITRHGFCLIVANMVAASFLRSLHDLHKMLLVLKNRLICSLKSTTVLLTDCLELFCVYKPFLNSGMNREAKLFYPLLFGTVTMVTDIVKKNY